MQRLKIGYKKGIPTKKPRFFEEMIRKMDERRKWKNIAAEEGKGKDKELNTMKRGTDKARDVLERNM